MRTDNTLKKKDLRRYIRISTVLPVEFFILDHQGKQITPWLQGFTRDISKCGIGLVVNDLWKGFKAKLDLEGAHIFVKTNLPFKKGGLTSKAKIIWISQHDLTDFNQYFLGLEFIKPDKKELNSLFKYAIFKKTIPFIIGLLLIILVGLNVFISWQSKLAADKNRKLVEEYVDIVDKSSQAQKDIGRQKDNVVFLKKRQSVLKNNIATLEEELNRWRIKYDEAVKRGTKEKLIDQKTIEGDIQKKYTVTEEDKKRQEQLLQEVEQLRQKINYNQEQLALAKRENEFLKNKEQEKAYEEKQLQQEADRLSQEKQAFSKKVAEGMYQWIKNRQDLKSGLVLSYEGDQNFDEISFTYDQALAAMVFMIYQDTEGARKILDFYMSRINKGEDIYNAYYKNGEPGEFVMHSGPNAWIGLAALDYVKRTGEKKYLAIAKKVADFLFKMSDKEGGIKGGPKDSWYATEHNLDGYAFFTLLNQMYPDKKYLDTANRIKDWMSRYSYTQYGPPVKRGKGDSTIATDTYAWSVTALGPQELLDLKMDPDTILEFAIEHCSVQVNFPRPQGNSIAVKGFDFAKLANTPRGGVISCEWTSQMILAFEIMADFYKDKDRDKYNNNLGLAQAYFNEISKMIITSISKFGKVDPCLPYASRSNVDTGHGWRTPQGDRVGSLAGTAYFLFAYNGYNPLTAQSLTISLKDIVTGQDN